MTPGNEDQGPEPGNQSPTYGTSELAAALLSVLYWINVIKAIGPAARRQFAAVLHEAADQLENTKHE